MSKPIKNIKKAIWLTSMNHYPTTLDDMKLLISLVDKMNILRNCDLDYISEMTYQGLNIMYAILRITNKIYTKHSDHIVEKILVGSFRKLISEIDNEVLVDQMIQDFNYFVTLMVRKHYPNMQARSLTEELIMYLKNTFRSPFYKTHLSSAYSTNEFYSQNRVFFDKLAIKLIKYLDFYLKPTYLNMKVLIDTIFDENVINTRLDQIEKNLEKYIDLEKLFQEDCTELDIYCEEKCNDNALVKSSYCTRDELSPDDTIDTLKELPKKIEIDEKKKDKILPKRPRLSSLSLT